MSEKIEVSQEQFERAAKIGEEILYWAKAQGISKDDFILALHLLIAFFGRTKRDQRAILRNLTAD